LTVEIVSTLAAVDSAQWNRLTRGNRFLRHEVLHALHETGCASDRSGWSPRFPAAVEGKRLTMARGLMPVQTLSVRWLAHPQFAEAVEAFLARETQGIDHYIDELRERTPFAAHPLP